LAANPKAFEVLEAKVAVYMLQNDADRARAFCLEQMKKFPDSPLLYDLLGRVETSGKQIDKAEDYFLKASELSPKWLVPYYRVAGLYFNSGEMEKGIKKFEQALEANPDSVRTAFTLGTLYQRIGDIEQAKKHYQAILEKHPDFVPAANNLAYIYAEHATGTKQLEEALELAKRAAVTQDSAALDTLGWVYHKLGNSEMALETLNKALEKKPEDPDISYHLAKVLLEKGDKEKAGAVLEKILQDGQSLRNKDEIQKLYDSIK